MKIYNFLKILNFKFIYFLIILKFFENLEIFEFFGNFGNFDIFCILPRVPDYCASLWSRMPPVTLYWFPVASFPMQGILSISAKDLESKYCYFYHIWDFVPYYRVFVHSKLTISQTVCL